MAAAIAAAVPLPAAVTLRNPTPQRKAEAHYAVGAGTSESFVMRRRMAR